MVIRIRNLNHNYSNNRRALIDINLDILQGKKTAILGINGSGKSTLLYHFNGTIIAQSGSVEVLGMEALEGNLQQIRRQVGFLFDYPDHQLFSTNVYNDIRFGLDNYQYPENEKKKLIRKIAQQFDIQDLLDYPPFQLSLGQKKKVAIAGLMVLEPQLIVCDEPFAGLDCLGIKFFKNILDFWVREGKSIVFSTHDVDLTYEWADNVIILREGRVLAAGTVDDVLNDGQIYSKAELVKPLLLELFSQNNYQPKSIMQAKDYLKKIKSRF